MNDTVSIRGLFLAWLKIGCMSFGGGAVTQYLIQENFIYKRRWISPEEYSRIIAMSQIAPPTS
jgi:chromate transporter